MTTRTAVGPWLRRHFPKAPSRQELYVRLPLVVLGVVAYLLWAVLKPSGRTLSLEGLWFQLGAAALLWFEFER